MKNLIAAWRYWRACCEFDRRAARGTPVEIVTPVGGFQRAPYVVTTPGVSLTSGSSVTFNYRSTL